jgi:ribosomal subunit interface protein
MKLTFKITQLENSDAFQAYAEKKLSSLDKLTRRFGESVAGWVELARTTRHHQEGQVFRAEVDLRIPGKILRAESEAADLYAAIDEVQAELFRQLKEHREKLITRFRRSARKVKDFFRFNY